MSFEIVIAQRGQLSTVIVYDENMEELTCIEALSREHARTLAADVGLILARTRQAAVLIRDDHLPDNKRAGNHGLFREAA